MTVKCRVLLPIVLSCVLIIGCQRQYRDWPEQVRAAIWIPRGAKSLSYNYFRMSTYEIKYRAVACYPGKEFLDSLGKEMSKKGWTRLEYDFLTPTKKLKNAQDRTGYWAHIIEGKNDNRYRWVDDWEDSFGNVVRYELSYRARDNDNLFRICDLNVFAVYIPRDVRKSLSDDLSVKAH